MNKDNRGVSLIELIVVITIIAVLGGLLMPQYFGYLRKSKIDMRQSIARSLLACDVTF